MTRSISTQLNSGLTGEIDDGLDPQTHLLQRHTQRKTGLDRRLLSSGKDGKLHRHIETHEKRGKARDRLKEIQDEVDKGIHTPERESVTVAEAVDL